MSDEWGEWQWHDGKGCPCVGERVQAEHNTGILVVSIAGSHPLMSDPGAPDGSWNWKNWPRRTKIIRYRIRKPRGLTILENLIADLPAPVGPKVDVLLGVGLAASK